MARLKVSRRKGLTQGLEIILVLAVLLILVIFAAKMYGSINSRTTREACRTGVLAQSVVMSVDAPGVKGPAKEFLSPDCKTYNVKFYDNKVEINGKPIEVVDSRTKEATKKFNGLTSDIVNQVLAEELRWCWYQFLEGQRPILDKRNFISFKFSNPRLCLLCDEVYFDSSVKESSFTGFYEYIQSEPMKQSNITYYNYIAEGSSLCKHYNPPKVNCWEDYFKDQITDKSSDFTPENLAFDKSREGGYVVFFVMRGLEGGGISFNDKLSFFSSVLPSDELKNQCNSIRRGPME